MTDETKLDSLFEEARLHKALPSDDLMARVLADAQAVQDAASVKVVKPSYQPDRGRFWDLLGGWVGAASFATCAVLGIYLGYAGGDVIGFGATDFALEGSVLNDLSILAGDA
ncbi:MAG: hypothetical protein AAF826_08815 [Pseudomonadota bacterium]